MAMLCHRSNDHGFSLLSPLVYLLPERFHLISTGIREPLSLTVSLLILHVLREQRVRSVCRSFHLSLSLSLSFSAPYRCHSFSLFLSLSFSFFLFRFFSLSFFSFSSSLFFLYSTLAISLWLFPVISLSLSLGHTVAVRNIVMRSTMRAPEEIRRDKERDASSPEKD